MLRVDRVDADGRRTPIGGWSTFANHGTVNPSEYQVYTQDHHGAALRVFEARDPPPPGESRSASR